MGDRRNVHVLVDRAVCQDVRAATLWHTWEVVEQAANLAVYQTTDFAVYRALLRGVSLAFVRGVTRG